MRGGISILLGVVISILINGCALEEATQVDQKLIIASDYLTAQDTILFQSFSNATGIRIRILTLSPEKIVEHLKNQNADAQFDLVMLGKLSSVLEFDEIKFHYLSDKYLAKYASNLKVFHNREWIVTGLDPYFFSFERDTVNRPETYNQLGSGFLWASPDRESWDLFDVHFNYYLSGINNEEANKIQEQFDRNQVVYQLPNDSIVNQQFLLLKNSTYFSDQTLNKNTKRELSKSTNFKTGGVFADRHCLAIVDQARNLGNASDFLSYWDEHYNRDNFSPGKGSYPYPDKNGISNGVDFFMISEDKILEMLKIQKIK